MKVYYIETQEDYDALVIHLRELGYQYIYGSEFSEERPYVIVWWADMVMCSYQDLMEDKEFNSLPITKFKAEVNEMRFTKTNVLSEFSKWRDTSDGSTSGFYTAIYKLDDTPEKAVLPKFVAEWLEDKRSRIPEFHFESGARFMMIIGDALHKMNYDSVPEGISNWIFEGRNDRVLCNAIDYGYIIKEPLYAVKLGKLYIKERLVDSSFSTITMTTQVTEAYPFTVKTLAEEYARVIGAEVIDL